MDAIARKYYWAGYWAGQIDSLEGRDVTKPQPAAKLITIAGRRASDQVGGEMPDPDWSGMQAKPNTETDS